MKSKRFRNDSQTASGGVWGLLGRPGAPGGYYSKCLEAFEAVWAPFLVAPGGSRDPPGRALGLSRALLDVPEGVFVFQNDAHQKSSQKVAFFKLRGAIFSISEVLRDLVFHVNF